MQFFIPGLPEKKRNNRRKASEVKRQHTCPVAGCNKSYGQESTLRHHIKVKHAGVEAVAKSEQPEGEKTVPQMDEASEDSDDEAAPENEMLELASSSNDKKVYKRTPTGETKCDEEQEEDGDAGNRALLADI